MELSSGTQFHHSLDATPLSLFLPPHTPVVTTLNADTNYAGYSPAMATHNVRSPEWRNYANQTSFGSPGSVAKCLANSYVNDAMRSFPSGHASLSFAGLVYLTLVCRAAAAVNPADTFSPKACMAGLPVLLATWIALTRVQDNFHREVDVSIGALIGIGCAFGAWKHARGAGRVPPPLIAAKRQEGPSANEGGAFI